MKFLITGMPGSNSIPVEQGAELLQASKTWIKSNLEAGTIDATYNIFGGGGMAIANAGSHGDLLAMLLAYPLYPFFDWEVTPLLDFETTYDAYIGYYQRLSVQ